MPGGLIVWEPDDLTDPASLRVRYANATACELVGMDVRQRYGDRVFELFPQASPERVRQYLEVCRIRQARDVGFVRRSKENDRSYSIRAYPFLSRAVAVVFEDATARSAAESEALHLSMFLDSIIEHIPAMVFMKDAEQLRFERFNRAGEELLGMAREDLLGRSDFDFFPQAQAEFFVAKDREVLQGGVCDIPEEPIQTANGERWLHTRKIPLLDDQGVPQHLLGVSIDITAMKLAKDELERRVLERTKELALQVEERLRAERNLALTEEQLRQAQKMEAIGRLAGGVAHDFNNILSAILSYSSLALSELGESDVARSELNEVISAAERASQLTRQLLAFSRRQMLEPRIVDLNEVISRLQSMLRRLIGEDVELKTTLAPTLSPVRVDVGQIEQVVMNLAVNARDAMPRGGALALATANELLTEGALATGLELPPGAYVTLTVQDTGAGIEPTLLERIFEPFFTTKEVGKGTGLGLSTVFGIVKQSGGGICVESQPEKGAKFTVYLPSLNETLPPRGEPTRRPPTRAVEATTVLLVEDNEPVRKAVLSILKRGGYAVLEAGSASEALKLVDAEPRNIDVLLTDVVMPGMSGPDLAQRLLSERPGLRVLCMSGYADDAILNHGILAADFGFIQKPIAPEALLSKLREVLEKPLK